MPAADAPRHAIDRLGAALAAPTRALAAADAATGGGRAPADLAVLVLVAYCATHSIELARAAWLLAEGEALAAAHLAVGGLGDWLRAPVAGALLGGLVITLAAGRRRSPGSDLDLACVACVPLAALAAVAQLIDRAAWIDPAVLARGSLFAGAAWSAALVALGLRQARRRQEAS